MDSKMRDFLKNKKNVGLEEICQYCLQDKNFVNEFCRLTNTENPLKRTPMDIEIDKTCNNNVEQKFIEKFTLFIIETIWNPLQLNEKLWKN